MDGSLLYPYVQSGEMLNLMCCGETEHAYFPGAAVSSDFTQQTFPNMLTMGSLGVSVLGLITSVVKYVRLCRQTAPAEKTRDETQRRSELIALIVPFFTFAVIAAYSVLFDRIGFIWPSLIALPILCLICRCRKWYFWASVFGFTALMFVLFRYVLLVPLP